VCCEIISRSTRPGEDAQCPPTKLTPDLALYKFYIFTAQEVGVYLTGAK